MIKSEELTNPASCMSRAREDEMTFVLLGRDSAAPKTIRYWVQERIRLGKNSSEDPQMIEALACADRMERTGTADDAISERPIQVGDTVRHKAEGWTQVVTGITDPHRATKFEALAFFEGGGFWRLSQLERVDPEKGPNE